MEQAVREAKDALGVLLRNRDGAVKITRGGVLRKAADIPDPQLASMYEAGEPAVSVDRAAAFQAHWPTSTRCARRRYPDPAQDSRGIRIHECCAHGADPVPLISRLEQSAGLP